MKRSGILNRHLAGAIAGLGHGDGVLVCGAGMPIPPGPRVVDLAFRAGTPSFAEVVEGLLDELVVEGATAAEEIRDANPAGRGAPGRLLPRAGTGPARRAEGAYGGGPPRRTDGGGPALRQRAAAVRGVLLRERDDGGTERVTPPYRACSFGHGAVTGGEQVSGSGAGQSRATSSASAPASASSPGPAGPPGSVMYVSRRISIIRAVTRESLP